MCINAVFSGPEKSKFRAKGCLNRDGICKARFPWPVVLESTVTNSVINEFLTC